MAKGQINWTACSQSRILRTIDGATAVRAEPDAGGDPAGPLAGPGAAAAPAGESPAGEPAVAARVATDPMEAAVPLMAPLRPLGKNPPMPLPSPRIAMLITFTLPNSCYSRATPGLLSDGEG